MSDQYLGEIRIFGGNFAPSGWAMCNGQTLAIAQNTALFSLLGTYYGGNGTTTFNLPDLRSRVPVCMGQGNGLSPYVIGQVGGSENTTLNINNLPVHAHAVALQASGNQADQSNPQAAIFGAANDGNTNAVYPYTKGSATTTMAPQNTSSTGGNTPAPVIQPYLALNYIIALQGLYPSRN